MAKDRIITTIDVGSSKVVCLIAEVAEADQIRVIGVSANPSRGIKKGVIVDIDQAVDVIAETLESAERMAGVTVSRVWVTVNGSHIASVNSQGVVAVSAPDGEITPNDVERVVEAAKAISMPSSREIVHVIPRTFIVDQQEGIDDPIGMSGVRLQVETHIISGAATSMRNLVKCIQEVGLDVENLIFAGIASSEAMLTATEKELGVVMVDIGGGTTDFVVYQDGAPVYSSVLKLGGKNITSDIAIGLRVPLEDAEEIKKYAGKKRPQPTMSDARLPSKSSDEESLDVSELRLESVQKIDRKFLVDGIIRPRLEEMAEEIINELRKSGLEGLTPAGIVVGGGGSYTLGLVETFAKELRYPVRIGTPTGVTGLVDEIKGAEYASSIGSVLHGLKGASIAHTSGTAFGGFKVPFAKLGKSKDKVVGFIKGFLPQ